MNNESDDDGGERTNAIYNPPPPPKKPKTTPKKAKVKKEKRPIVDIITDIDEWNRLLEVPLPSGSIRIFRGKASPVKW